MGSKEIYTSEELLRPIDLGNPVSVDKVFKYLKAFQAASLPWFQEVTVLSHIANASLFSAQIATKASEVGTPVDIHKVWLMGWLRDFGRVAWGIASEQKMTEITEKYGHHGLLGYQLLIQSGVPEELAAISMTHIGSGISSAETEQINRILGKNIFPVRDWFAKTLEEKIAVIGDKVPGWNNTVVSHYEAQEKGDIKGNKIYSWLEDQAPLWERFWTFKREVDSACNCDALTLFDPGLLSSDPSSYAKLPPANEIAQIVY